MRRISINLGTLHCPCSILEGALSCLIVFRLYSACGRDGSAGYLRQTGVGFFGLSA